MTFAGINALCGIGILSTPYAAKEGGWVGLSILLLYAVFSFYTGLLLRYCLDSAPGLETYPDIGQAAFGTTGRVIISVILAQISLILFEYALIFLSSTVNFKALVSNWYCFSIFSFCGCR